MFLSAPYRRKSTCAVWPVCMNSPPGTNFSITWRPRATPLPSPITLLKQARNRRTPGRTDNREANRKTEGCPSECTFVPENKTAAVFYSLTCSCATIRKSAFLFPMGWHFFLLMRHMPKDFPRTAIYSHHHWRVIWCLRALLSANETWIFLSRPCMFFVFRRLKIIISLLKMAHFVTFSCVFIITIPDW